MSAVSSEITHESGYAKGVAIAIVTQNKDDDGLCRVKVRYPWHEKPRESYWARLAVPMAGNGRGTVFIPEVGDEVLVSTDRPTDDRKAFLGRGWAMPVALDSRTGLVPSVAYEEDIRQSILIILETSPGERVMRSNFGCGIHDLVFTAVDSTTIQQIRSTVEEALRRCEARIDVLNVNVDEAATFDGQLLVEIEYRVRRTNQLGNLVFPFYFREGGQP